MDFTRGAGGRGTTSRSEGSSRRAVLGSVGLAGAAALAGCMGASAPGGGTDDGDDGRNSDDDGDENGGQGDGDGSDRGDDSTNGGDEGCETPSDVVETSFDQGEGDCGAEHAAELDVEGSTVRIDGRLRTPVPCYDLELECVEVEDGTLVVLVAAANRHEGVCIECVGEVPYEATVGFDDAPPDSIAVRHRDADGVVETVTETEQ